MISEPGQQDSALSRLKALLLGDERARLAQHEVDLERLAARDDALADRLPELIERTRERDPERLAHALSEPVAEALGSAVERKRQLIVDLLFPVIGPGIRKAIDWPHAPFVVPDEVLKEWRKIGAQGARHREAWAKRLAASDKRGAFEAALAGKVPEGLKGAFNAHKRQVVEAQKADATRKWSGAALEVATELMPELIGGSADLSALRSLVTSRPRRCASAWRFRTPRCCPGSRSART